MRRTVSIWWVVAFIGVVLLVFLAYSSKLSDEIAMLQSMLDDDKISLAQAEAKKTNLDNKLKNAGTDAYIENEARNVYDYMMRNEIRFIISNPHSNDDSLAGTP